MTRQILASKKRHQKQKGMTLLELMVALALSAFLMIGVTQTFVANQQSNRVQKTFARVQESGRLASEFLMRDLRNADYWGCISDPDRVDAVDHLDKDDDDWTQAKSDLINLIGDGVSGADNVISATSIDGTTAIIDGTDTITLTGASPEGGGKVELESPYHNAQNATIHAKPGHTLQEGDIILLTNCSNQADLFSVSNTNASAGQIVHNTGNITEDGAVDNDFKELGDHSYDADTQIVQPYSVQYFIGASQADPSGNGRSLYRSADGATAIELVPNVWDMQLLYGEDRDDNGFIERYDVAGAASQEMDNVKTVRVQLLVYGEEDVDYEPIQWQGATVTAPSLDDRMLKIYSFTVGIRNRL